MAGPSLDGLRQARYQGIDGLPRAVRLRDGRWQGRPATTGDASRPTLQLMEQPLAYGDLTGDGQPEAAVVLVSSFGGSGTFRYLAVVEQRGPRLLNRQTWALGDRVQVQALRIDSGRVRVDLLRPGPGDPACCPTEAATLFFTPGEAAPEVHRP